jgi:hypothetical protein
MTKDRFLKIMQFPSEWLSFGMYPDDLAEWQLAGYEPGHEDASECDRNGAFHWWLRRSPTKVELEKLLRLAALDPDRLLGNDVREYIRRSPLFDEQLASLEPNLFK